MNKVYCIFCCFTQKNWNQGIHTGWLTHGGAYMRGAYTWSKTSVKEKEGTYLQETGGGGGLIGREIQYAVQSHFKTYNFQMQWIILQFLISQLKNKQALSDFWHWGHNWDPECEAKFKT